MQSTAEAKQGAAGQSDGKAAQNDAGQGTAAARPSIRQHSGGYATTGAARRDWRNDMEPMTMADCGRWTFDVDDPRAWDGTWDEDEDEDEEADE